MRNKIFPIRGHQSGIVFLLTAVFMLVGVVPAFSWGNVNTITYSFKRQVCNNQDVDGARIRAQGYANGGVWPVSLMPITNTLPLGRANTSVIANNGNLWTPAASGFSGSPNFYTRVQFGGHGDQMYNNPTTWWFMVKYKFNPSPLPGLKMTYAQFHWTLSLLGQHPADLVCGNWSGLGWKWASPPALYNPAVTLDGTVNTDDMVVRDVQFAVSPTLIPNDETTLDNPVVLGLFAASSDPLRPGPIVIAPGSTYDMTLDPSITDPQLGGATVLAKGTVDDGNGNQVPFLVQFVVETEDAGTPVGYNPQWLIITLVSLALAGGLLFRKRMGKQ